MADEGYCEREDVRRVLREDSLEGALGQEPEIIDDAITGQTEDLHRKTKAHWYSGGTTTLVPTSTRSVTDILLDVPSGPHAQDRQILRSERGVEYPTTNAGPFVKLRLPHHGVSAINRLAVRDRGGGFTDWVADSDFKQGTDEDYYRTTEGEYDVSYLYVRAATIGPRTNFDNLLEVDYDYGITPVPESIRRATALLAAEELVLDEDAKTSIPSEGQLVSLQTKADQYHQRAMSKLESWLEIEVA